MRLRRKLRNNHELSSSPACTFMRISSDCTYLDRVEDTRGNWGSFSSWDPSWSSLRRLSTSWARLPKKPCCREVSPSLRSGHGSLSWLKKGSSPNRMLKAACWDIVSGVRRQILTQTRKKLPPAFKGTGECSPCDSWLEDSKEEWGLVWGTPGFSPLYTPAVLIRPPAPLAAIYTSWAHSCLWACNSEVRNALHLISGLKTAHGHILFGFGCMCSCHGYTLVSVDTDLCHKRQAKD